MLHVTLNFDNLKYCIVHILDGEYVFLGTIQNCCKLSIKNRLLLNLRNMILHASYHVFSLPKGIFILFIGSFSVVNKFLRLLQLCL